MLNKKTFTASVLLMAVFGMNSANAQTLGELADKQRVKRNKETNPELSVAPVKPVIVGKRIKEKSFKLLSLYDQSGTNKALANDRGALRVLQVGDYIAGHLVYDLSNTVMQLQGECKSASQCNPIVIRIGEGV